MELSGQVRPATEEEKKRCCSCHTPVLHARVFPRRLLQGDVARREGAEAACDDGYGAELGPGLVHHVGAGGVLLAVLAVAPLQVVVGAGDGHLHGCSGVRTQPHAGLCSTNSSLLLRNSLCVRAEEKAPEEGWKSVTGERRDGGAPPSSWFLR